MNTSLSRMFYIQLNFQNLFTRLRNWLFTCKNIRHVIFGMRHDLPRGLVVRILTAAARVRFPAWEWYDFFNNLFLSVEGVWPVTKALCKSLLPDITEDEKMCISLFSWIRYWLKSSVTWFYDFQFIEKSNFLITSGLKNTWMILNTIAST